MNTTTHPEQERGGVCVRVCVYVCVCVCVCVCVPKAISDIYKSLHLHLLGLQ